MKTHTFKKYSPSPRLLQYIDTYWSVCNHTDEIIDLPVVPDGCMDIIHREFAHSREMILVGAMDEAIVVSLAPSDYYFGIQFKPAILSFLLDQNMSEFSNQIVPLKEVSGGLHGKLNIAEHNDESRVEMFNTILEREFLSIEVDERIMALVNMTAQSRGETTVMQMVESSDLSQRQLERLFLPHLGYSPKKFIDVVRFYNAHRGIIKEGINDLAGIAHSCGYCDQAHFNKAFKRFTRFAPKDKHMAILYNTSE